jgi:glycosyltransferase involved in cell wall biosynthesis
MLAELERRPMVAPAVISDEAETVLDNAAWSRARPRLSVLTPFYRDDPRALLDALDRQSDGDAVEIVLLDDGGVVAATSTAVEAHLATLSAPVRLVRLSANEGRSKGRNRLARHARANALLFLDADMLPDAEDFLARWLAEVGDGAAVAFGGFTVDAAPLDPGTNLHRRMSQRSDCAPAAVRALAPEKHVFTSNLLIRRDVFEAERFDEAFTGWGWEDVEWGMRVARRWPIRHIDNTATHLGLDSAPALLGKYEQSAANFARVLAAHPEVVSTYPSFRAAKLLRRAPLPRLWRPMLKRLALAPWAPLDLRAFSARLYRAALYAEVL